ncbi:MAG: hypothetical protein A2Z88_06235 [Omnitrophica WOR_2 bacterium GWA2_47_8]|nr:MAG: hypothetical protein A2Z88_06235 [Omnitrophica WOR_2 bacterium GWA2_47_8]
MPLNFYLGEAERLFFGPLGQIISGSLFLCFCLFYGKQLTPKVFGAAVFFYLLITKSEVLFFPPYGDAVGGPFLEAVWLSRHGFDYGGLFHQTGYALGGPKVYVFSIYPTFLALLLKLIPSAKLFLAVNHLVMFLIATLTVVYFRKILEYVFEIKTAFLGALVLLFYPLFQAQAEAINMEMPCLLFAVLSAYALIQNNVRRAGIFAILSVAIKGTGVYACAAVFLASWFKFFAGGKRITPELIWGNLSFFFAALIFGAKFWIQDQHVSGGMIHLFAGWPSLKAMFIFYLFILGLGVLLWTVIKDRKAVQEKGFSAVSIVFLYALTWFFLFLNFLAVSPRYRLTVSPFIIFIFIWSVTALNLPARLRNIILIGMMAASWVFSYGGNEKNTDYVIMEQNLEYRNDLKMYRQIAKELEGAREYDQVVAPFIVAQILAYPEMGYVQKPLNVTMYAMPSALPEIKSFTGLRQLNISRTIWVATDYVTPIQGEHPFPIGPEDRVVRKIYFGDKKATLFMGGIAVELRRLVLEKLLERK